MSEPILIIIMGSGSDEAHSRKIAEAASRLGLATELRVASAHKTPGDLVAMLAAYEADGRPKVYVTVAGRSNALSGFVDGAVDSPVIACPPPSESYGGADLWSSVRMPSGVAPAFVMDAGNAALLAAKILSLAEPSIRPKLATEKGRRVEEIRAADQALRGTGPSGSGTR
ncbi:MAG TPA: AIR carboxylase family protein [Rectinemataceae bacterium]|nr:AIR carboxylase family protein [Rectinemataceae bacterium]